MLSASAGAPLALCLGAASGVPLRSAEAVRGAEASVTASCAVWLVPAFRTLLGSRHPHGRVPWGGLPENAPRWGLPIILAPGSGLPWLPILGSDDRPHTGDMAHRDLLDPTGLWLHFSKRCDTVSGPPFSLGVGKLAGSLEQTGGRPQAHRPAADTWPHCVLQTRTSHLIARFTSYLPACSGTPPTSCCWLPPRPHCRSC